MNTNHERDLLLALGDVEFLLKERWGPNARVYVKASVFSESAYDTVDYPLMDAKSGLSWRSWDVTKYITVCYHSPHPNPYETAPDEWLMLSYNYGWKRV